MSTPLVTLHVPSPVPDLPASRQQHLIRLAAGILAQEKHPAADVSIILGPDSLLHGLNRQYRHRDCPTDVLSFGLYRNQAAGTECGDIYISLNRARTQGGQYHTGFTGELKRLVVHGTFHLCGYDHYRPEDRAEMEKKSEKWLLRRSLKAVK